MKRVFVSLPLCLFSIFCFSQPGKSKCGDFKTGKFIYTDSAKNTITITRTAKKQKEVDLKSNITTILKIKWLSECEYQLTQTWSNSKAKRKQNGSSTTIIITQVYDTGRYDYTCKCTAASDRSITGTMIRVNE